MKILILLSCNPGNGFLVTLHKKEHVKEIRKHIANRDNPKAIAAALTKGKIEREVSHEEAHTVDAELIITKDRVCWDATK